MTKKSSPRVPAYRITLFYGPEYIQDSGKTVQCVFNVKKRSWKGGVQIVVNLGEMQLLRVGRSLQFTEWLEDILTRLPENSRQESEARARDLFAQQVCWVKLQQAIRQGIRQENMELDSEMFLHELEEVVLQEANNIKEQVLTELDVQEIVAQDVS